MFWFLEFSHTLQTGADRQDSRGSKTNRPRMGGGGEGRFPRPDVTKMVPYLPEMATTAPSPPALAGPGTEDNATPAASTVLFGLPPPLLTVVQMLPPASSYQGMYLEHPFQQFPFLKRTSRHSTKHRHGTRLDPRYASPSAGQGDAKGAFMFNGVMTGSPTFHQLAKKQGKRKAAELEDTQNRPPTHDIFRKRQAAKLKGQQQ